MTVKWQDAALLLIAFFILAFIFSRGSMPGENIPIVQEKEILQTRIDTAHSVVEIPMRPLTVAGTANRTKIIVLHDTVVREACLDTLITSDTAAIAPDTLAVCYARDTFSFALGLSARRKNVAIPYMAHDTFYWRENTPPAYEPKRAWYDDVLVIILSLAAGIIVGKL